MNRRGALGVLAATSYADFSQFGARLIPNPLVPSIIVTYQMTKGDIGFMLTAMWAVFAPKQYPEVC